ncbi:MAG: hypothetical protein KGV58_00775 [Campylobacteraceae bacterium]|nr:hypothetical protein [Campylobacteraceae bacterium]
MCSNLSNYKSLTSTGSASSYTNTFKVLNSLLEESFEDGLLEAPSFSKPNIFEKNSVPLEFLKGNHGKIIGLKKEMAKHKTKFFRPDLYKKCIKRIKYEK